jgi:hypothetical protein
MWFIGGSKTRTRLVADGRSLRYFCEECKALVVFREHDVTDKLSAFFVELFETTQRRMVCGECGEDHDVEELFAAARVKPAAAAQLPHPAPVKRLESKKEPDADVDEMLAALKHRMAKK